MIAITVCATKSYCYAAFAQARRVQAAIAHLAEGVVILVGDASNEFERMIETWKQVLPQGWSVEAIKIAGLEEHVNYKPNAQLVIAQMRTAAFTRARQLRVTQCWSLDSEVLPQEDALVCMQDMLHFARSYYSVATCPYPSQGGSGLFLGGRGTPQRPICPDVYEDERTLPEELVKDLQEHRSIPPGGEGWMERERELRKRVDQCPPLGTVWALNDRRYRMRGWMNYAYPGIGRGSVVPSDWCGFGCTLMNQHALALAQFDGYGGEGTEDLYIVWKRWFRAGLRICVITHSPADHVVRKKNADGTKLIQLQQTYHEWFGEYVGHLRIEDRPWYQGEPGEFIPEPEILLAAELPEPAKVASIEDKPAEPYSTSPDAVAAE